MLPIILNPSGWRGRHPKLAGAWIALAICCLVFTAGCKEERPDDFVELNQAVPGIRLDIRYATTNNFTGKQVYPVARCFLRRAAAQKLAAVQNELASQGLGLKVYDGYRPLSIQRKFWEILPDERYVANPAKGSKHNRGAAVDLTVVRADGTELAMPTPWDDFTEKAHHNYQELPAETLKNRALLREVMTKHGFVIFPSEWWHYDDAEWEKYPIMDVDVNRVK